MSDERETTSEYEQYDFPGLLNSFIDADNEAERQASQSVGGKMGVHEQALQRTDRQHAVMQI